MQDLVNKMKKLRQKYKQEKDKSNKNRTGRRKKWKCFDIMDTIMSDKPQVKPPLIFDSSTPSTSELPSAIPVDENPETGKFVSFFCVFSRTSLCLT